MREIFRDNYTIISRFAFCLNIMICSLVANDIWAAPTDATMVMNIMCAVINQVTGPVGQAIAIMIFVSLGIMLLLGKVTWGVAIALMVGMGIMFGAKEIVPMLTSSGVAIC